MTTARDPLPRKPGFLLVLAFFLSGFVAVFSLLFLASGASDLGPWFVVSSAMLVLSGYRIWRARNPRRSAVHELGVRVVAVIGVVGTAIGIAVVRAQPTIVVLVIGAFVVVVGSFFLLMARIEDGVLPKRGPGDDHPR